MVIDMKLLKKWLAEIAFLGFSDWWFWVVVLRRNEFNPKLTIYNVYKGVRGAFRLKRTMCYVVSARRRAHEIEDRMSYFGNPYRCQKCGKQLAQVNGCCARCMP